MDKDRKKRIEEILGVKGGYTDNPDIKRIANAFYSLIQEEVDPLMEALEKIEKIAIRTKVLNDKDVFIDEIVIIAQQAIKKSEVE